MMQRDLTTPNFQLSVETDDNYQFTPNDSMPLGTENEGYRNFIQELKLEQEKLKKDLVEIQNYDVLSEQHHYIGSIRNPS